MAKNLQPASEFVLQKCSNSSPYLEDRISQLPDEILVAILSLMTMEEAAQTSILSHRWKNLWKFITGSLDFDASVVIKEFKWLRFPEYLEPLKFSYIDWVNQVLNSHKGVTIEEFRVLFDLGTSSGSDIDRWINFAIQKKVRRLEVDLKGVNPKDECYPFPVQSLGFSNIKFLTALRLNDVYVTGQVLEQLLVNCPFLEFLRVSRSTGLVGLKVCGALNLKYLEIVFCDYLEYFEISALNLKSLTYGGPNIGLLFKDVPNLAALSFKGGYCYFLYDKFCELSGVISQIETLTLDYGQCEKFPEFPLSNLKQLELIVRSTNGNSLLSCIALIEACPLLYRFVLQFERYVGLSPKKVQKTKGCPLKCLKRVELRGYSGRPTDVELAKYLMDHAPSLEKIIVDTRECYPSLKMTDEIIAAIVHVRYLAKRRSPHAKVLIL